MAAQSREIDRLNHDKQQMSRLLMAQCSDYMDSSSFFNVVGDTSTERQTVIGN